MAAKLFSAFRHNRKGSIAVVFALCLYPILMMVCTAMDISRASQQQAKLQSALDAAALIAARYIGDGGLPAGLDVIVRQAVEANLGSDALRNLTVSAVLDGASVKVTGSGQFDSAMGGLMSGKLQVDGLSRAVWRTKKIDLVLVLDNTGSMSSSGKMTALKAAAKNLIDSLAAAAANRPDAVRIGIVPFDVQVRIGTTYAAQPWLTYAGVNNLNATNWTGCVIDRDQSYDVDDTVPSSAAPSTLFPARNCTNSNLTSILPLTTDWTALRNKVDAMTPSGNTNVTIGLVWGLHMLTPSQPLTNARTLATEPDLERIIILLTDGDNTQNRWSTNGTTIDARTDLACANTKANGIRLYTIRVIDGDAALLRRCASTASMYYNVTSAAELGPVFQRLAAEIGQLRLTQ